MGNTLVHNDGLDTADLSAVESFSAGTYGEGIYEDQTNSDSANTQSRDQFLNTYDRRQRRGHNNNNNNNSRSNNKHYQGRYNDGYTDTDPYTEESVTGTTTSSLHDHYGYKTDHHERRYHDYHHHHNETRDDRSEEYRASSHNDDDIGAYRNDPRAYINDRLQEYEKARKAQQLQSDLLHQKAMGKATTAMLGVLEDDDAATFGKDTMGEIFPAETDMAYADSQDGSEFQPPQQQIAPPAKKKSNNSSHPELPSTASSVLGSLKRLEAEQRQEKHKHKNKNHDSDSLSKFNNSDSFSTLTKTIGTMQKLTKRNKLKQKMMSQQGGISEEMLAKNPGNKKLQEMLRQQQLQEEKLQRQLEELRLQKERLQQLQQGSTGNIYTDYQSIHIQLQAERHEQEHRDRLARARENCMPLSPTGQQDASEYSATSDVDEPEIIHLEDEAESKIIHLEDEAESEIVVVDDFESIENKYINATYDNEDDDGEEEEEQKEKEEVDDDGDGDDDSSATGEGSGLAPEFEDVPIHCSVDPDAAYHPFVGESLSQTVTQLDTMGTEKLEFMSTLTSIKDEERETSEYEEQEGTEKDHDDADENNSNDSDNENNSDGESRVVIDNALSKVISSMDDDIDLEFVAAYDAAFNTFLESFPLHFDEDSDLVQNLKIAKLQKILEASYQTEADLEAHLEKSKNGNADLEAEFQQKLREASKFKAARMIELQSEVKRMKMKNRMIEGKLTWDVLAFAMSRAHKLRALETSWEKHTKEISNREDLIKLLPEQTRMQDVRTALKVEPKVDFGPEHQKLLQQLQVDNALLNSEVKVLQQKISNQKEQAKNQAWVDEILLKLDHMKLEQLKARYKKKLGVSF